MCRDIGVRKIEIKDQLRAGYELNDGPGRCWRIAGTLYHRFLEAINVVTGLFLLLDVRAISTTWWDTSSMEFHLLHCWLQTWFSTQSVTSKTDRYVTPWIARFGPATNKCKSASKTVMHAFDSFFQVCDLQLIFIAQTAIFMFNVSTDSLPGRTVLNCKAITNGSLRICQKLSTTKVR